MFQFHLPIKIIFGTGSVDSLGKESAVFGKRALIVCGKNSLKAGGTLARLKNILHGEGVKASVFDEVSPEPDTAVVDRAIAYLKENKCDLVIGAGGGSAIDVAKSVAGLRKLARGETSADYLDVDGSRKVEEAGLPFLSLPTVAGTGAEVTQNSVLLSARTGNKRSLRSPLLFAKTCIIDPELTFGVPRSVTALAGIDCLAHLLEGYISATASPVGDVFAAEGMKLVKSALPKAVTSGLEDPATRSCMSLASLYGGAVIVASGLGLVHGLGSVLGAKYKLSHGLSCALVLPDVLEYNLPSVPENKRRVICELFGENPPQFLRDFITEIGLEEQLYLLGVRKEDIGEIAEKTLNASSTKKNPRQPTVGDLTALLEKIAI